MVISTHMGAGHAVFYSGKSYGSFVVSEGFSQGLDEIAVSQAKFNIIHAELRRMLISAGVCYFQQFLSEVLKVIMRPSGFIFNIDSTLLPFV